MRHNEIRRISWRIVHRKSEVSSLVKAKVSDKNKGCGVFPVTFGVKGRNRGEKKMEHGKVAGEDEWNEERREGGNREEELWGRREFGEFGRD
jgi:hypothetical protein